MISTQRLEFTGNPNRRPENPHKDSPTNPEPYVVSAELKKAVNLAIYLRRPLLLEGDAGCGKTRLASAVAYELGLPLYRWDIRSTTKAQDGLYEYDAILRLHDVHTQKLEQQPPAAEAETEEEDEERVNRNPANPKHYRKFGALGKAFELKNQPAVVLIDEIDKADLDFPNDLLTVLDEPWEFKIKETGETITATHKPIVIITSNKEKGNLPAPFLRRCLYHYLDFPNDPKRLQEIVEKHYQIREEESPPPPDLVNTAIKRFLAVWNEGGLFKKPGTSEFLDWLKALHTFESEPYKAAQLAKDKLLPYRELLFKLQQDWKKYAKAS
ncbi:MoxR family ATPase [Brasilonema octagenarum UFV-E1]|uniref:MoxR family ATPase n=2 Tax=Brasilonema TaxID=383614 RepID=A0A856MDN4_9CYAN|nr:MULTISPECIES: MoxR family ATPase [Brasilonema]NMF66982.1 MoxR family ATPase [Brasilonema octagenarum UFV-OR1]QDL09415.1 MoxR family ATPase [Brasilonema sennae CENA114]QDL15771.1 MoxR family ATPase [Brasilonema octagenarum UFV-E1]